VLEHVIEGNIDWIDYSCLSVWIWIEGLHYHIPLLLLLLLLLLQHHSVYYHVYYDNIYYY
jgi:hypothetical protein